MIEITPPPAYGRRFPDVKLEGLAIGSGCFVWLRQRLFGGVVIEQSGFDQWTRIETEAAREIRVGWLSMSFRWLDGLPAASRCDRDACVIVPKDEQEGLILAEIVRQNQPKKKLTKP